MYSVYVGALDEPDTIISVITDLSCEVDELHNILDFINDQLKEFNGTFREAVELFKQYMNQQKERN